jgi:hypothetical protein
MEWVGVPAVVVLYGQRLRPRRDARVRLRLVTLLLEVLPPATYRVVEGEAVVVAAMLRRAAAGVEEAEAHLTNDK